MPKIMTIEDSAFERKAIKDILSQSGYNELIEAETGEEGLELYAKERPDLVLLDLRLPGMDGIECLRRLRKIDPKAKVIIVSIVTRKDAVDECMKLGAKDYVMKPITSKKIIPAIKKVLK